MSESTVLEGWAPAMPALTVALDLAPLEVAAGLGEGDTDALGDDVGGAHARSGQEHGELLAAGTAKGVGGAQRTTREIGEGLQDAVAGAMAEAVVDRLEPVEVEDDQGERRVLLLAAVEQRLGGLHEGAAIGDAGQRIDARRGHVVHLGAFLGHGDGEDRGTDDEDQRLEVNQPEPAAEREGAEGRRLADGHLDGAGKEEQAVQEEEGRSAASATGGLLAAAPELRRRGEEVEGDDRQVERDWVGGDWRMTGIEEGDQPDHRAGGDARGMRPAAVAGAGRRPDEGRAGVEEEDADDGRGHAKDEVGRGEQRDGGAEREVAARPPQHPHGFAILHPGEDEKYAARGSHEAACEHQGWEIELHRQRPTSATP